MLRDDLYEAIKELPSIDIHSQIRRNNLTAESLKEVVFYHMLQYPFRSAGVDGRKFWVDGENSFHGSGRPVEELDSRWPVITNTGFAWILRLILKELYGFEGELGKEEIELLEKQHIQKNSDPSWGQKILTQANVHRIYTSKEDTGPDTMGPEFQFTLERSPEFGIYEFFSWTSRFRKIEKFTGVTISSINDLRNVNQRQYDRFDWNNKKAVVWWVSSCADFTPVDESALNALIQRCLNNERLSLQEEGLLEAAYIRSVCDAVRDRTKVIQLVYGTQFLTPGAHPVQRAVPQFASTLGYLFKEYEDFHFNILNGYEADEPVLCSLCLGYPNVSLGSFWWQTFYPSIMQNGWSRRLDMVPVSRLAGFFSDAYMVEWLYGRLRCTQWVLANVLAEKISQGFYTFDQSVQIARNILYDTPMVIFEG
jgi:glucuronate isomerase